MGRPAVPPLTIAFRAYLALSDEERRIFDGSLQLRKMQEGGAELPTTRKRKPQPKAEKGGAHQLTEND